MKFSQKLRAITLVETLVVLGIILVLAALIFPILKSSKIAAKKSVMHSNMMQLGKAQTLYALNHDDYHPLYTTFTNQYRKLGFVKEATGGYLWKQIILPYVAGSGEVFYSPLDIWAKSSPPPGDLPGDDFREYTSFDHFALIGVYGYPKDGVQYVVFQLSQIPNPSGYPWMDELGVGYIFMNGKRYDMPADGHSLGTLYFDGHVKRIQWPPSNVLNQ